ncbi:unnamed protein product [Didymodactylos carnosus]|uniref:Uncharacterized protein n=1 Tax=Didymodactylos carnosus TaxID=1234261 RepID=A0A815T6Y2_9BILA|nr:unnamed protein product [Didymodactylos carnosus]CAF1499748.1 unnamed protein product [Didymodactylos carnosus]CAF3512252.1 unnamed protein product [Didymodactylos carnosus]CAF4361583.1 unnamed protein product [Didymodactylos carnosus]
MMTTRTVKPKTFTLLEICENITNIRSSTSKTSLSPNVSHILTRRLYLHPLSKLKTRSMVEIETRQHINLEKKKLIKDRTHVSTRGLAILSSSLSLKTRKTTPLNYLSNETYHKRIQNQVTDSQLFEESIQGEDDDDEYEYLRTPTSSSMNTITPYSSSSDQWTKFNIWQHIDSVLQRPSPKQPPSTPLDMLSDYSIQGQLSPKKNTIERHSLRKKTINENEEFFSRQENIKK